MENILVLGGHGFVGYSVLEELVKLPNRIKCIVRNIPDRSERFANVEYIVGDIFDNNLLSACMEGMDSVYYFISTSMPNSGAQNLSNELAFTLRALDSTLDVMVKKNVKKFIFPSSGGAIYGGKSNESVDETAPLFPTTTYGVGKQLSENIIQYYCQRFGINAYVFRIGNVYGSKQLRKKQQGIIDIFVQAALLGEPVDIWGDASQSVRDYIYLEDVAKAVVMTSNHNLPGMKIYNVGTGRGTSVKDLIDIIESQLGNKLEIHYKPQKSSGVNRIVLDCNRIKNEIFWEPAVSLEDGINLTIDEKKEVLKL